MTKRVYEIQSTEYATVEDLNELITCIRVFMLNDKMYTMDNEEEIMKVALSSPYCFNRLTESEMIDLFYRIKEKDGKVNHLGELKSK